MRGWSVLLLMVIACTVQGPRGIPVAFTVRTQVRVDAHVQVSVPVQSAHVHVVTAPPPPPPAPPVALQGAPVVEFFGIPLEGAQDVVFVLDISGSMDEPARGAIAQIQAPANAPPPPPPPPGAPPAPPPPPGPRKIEVARAELVEALQRLPAGTRTNVVFFNNHVDAYAGAIAPLDEQSRSQLVGFVSETEADGSTALAPAMRVAFLMNARRIVLLSDGLGNVGGTAFDVLRDAREAMHSGIRIDAVGIGPDQDVRLLHALAAESGGLYQPL